MLEDLCEILQRANKLCPCPVLSDPCGSEPGLPSTASFHVPNLPALQPDVGLLPFIFLSCTRGIFLTLERFLWAGIRSNSFFRPYYLECYLFKLLAATQNIIEAICKLSGSF